MTEQSTKVVFVGDSGVGKTTLLERFCYGKYDVSIRQSLVSRYFEKNMPQNGSRDPIELMIWDTPGRNELRCFVEDSLKESQVNVIMYSLTDRQSFDNLSSWISFVSKSKEKNNIVIVENKQDLLQESLITPQESDLFAKRTGIPLFRVSSKDNLNIKNLFSHISSMIFHTHLKEQHVLPKGAEAFFGEEYEEFEIAEESAPSVPPTPRNTPAQQDGNCRI